MSKVTVNQGGGGIGFFGLLTIVFIILKLMGYIEWAWIWVLSPIWIPFAVVIGILIIAGIIALIASILGVKR